MDRINGSGTIDIGSGRRGFRDENLGTGIEGTEVTALFLNMVQEEVCKVIEDAGLALDPADWTQLLQALRIKFSGRNAKAWVPVISMTITAPPATPTTGDIYLVPTGATGAWVANAGYIAEWVGTKWAFTAPSNGHGISLPSGQVFEKVAGTYVEKLALDAQCGKWTYAVAGGTSSKLTATLAPVPASYASVIGMALRLAINATNPGAATLNVNSLGELPIKTMLGLDIGRGDLPAGSTVTLICTGTTWALAGIAYSEVPSVGDVTIYVRTDGSDSNDGSSNDSGHALATIGEALNRAKKAGSSNTVTIQLGVAGTYAERIVTANIAATIVVKGDTANQANYNIAPPGTIFSVLDINNANVSFQGIRLVPSGTVTHELYASSNATVSISNVTLSAAGTISGGLITAATGATITISAGCNILAGAGSALNVNGGTIAINENVAVGTPTYTAAFVAAANGGAVLRASTGPTFSGSATGTRYAASMNSIISTNGGGANYFPGTVAGSVSTGGQYA
ncbi:DUF2793 domain-containing protein [Rhizobium rhizogenes]